MGDLCKGDDKALQRGDDEDEAEEEVDGWMEEEGDNGVEDEAEDRDKPGTANKDTYQGWPEPTCQRWLRSQRTKTHRRPAGRPHPEQDPPSGMNAVSESNASLRIQPERDV